MTTREISPIIILPEDLKPRFEKKLEEYKQRIADPKNAYKAPEQMIWLMCKVFVFEQLIQNGQVDTWSLSQKAADKFEGVFDVVAFDNACAVADDYIKTGGKNISGGTGF